MTLFYRYISTPQVLLVRSTTKLLELKQILANEEHFGSRAPVRRQRLFHLGRELKSGGRSLCNLGLGKFNNRILHLYIRPEGGTANCDGGSRKRNRAPEQQCVGRQRPTNDAAGTIAIHEEERIVEGSNTNGRPVASMNNISTANNLAIDLVDSSDEDDEVEIIEVL